MDEPRSRCREQQIDRLVAAADRVLAHPDHPTPTLRTLCNEAGVALSSTIRRRITVNNILHELLWRAALTAGDIRGVTAHEPLIAPLEPLLRFVDLHASVVHLAAYAGRRDIRAMALACIASLLPAQIDPRCAALVAATLAQEPTATTAQRDLLLRRLITPLPRPATATLT